MKNNLQNIELYKESQPIVQIEQSLFFPYIDGDDSLELHIYLANHHYTSLYNLDKWSINSSEPNSILVTDTIQHLNDAEIYSGKYNVIYNGYKNLYPDNIGIASIEEISDDRTEVRIKLTNTDTTIRKSHINIISQLPFYDLNGISTNIHLNLFDNNIIPTLNWVRADSDSIIYKLIKPLPDSAKLNDTLYIIVPLFNTLQFDITLYTENLPQTVTILNSPNWLAANSIHSKKESAFYNWDTLLAYNPTGSTQLINQYLSGSLSGMQLNTDYSKYANFIFYSSAEERLKNFKYKVNLIETYTNTIAVLDTQISSSTVIDVSVLNNNLTKYQQKLNNLFGTFDEYEKYLYYQSSSLDVESPTWPKTSNVKPYTLYSITSSFISDVWYDNQLNSASYYDSNNVNSLINTIPEHIYTDELNAGYITFVQMISHHYDILWLYINNITKLSDRQESIDRGLPSDLIYHVLKSFGWEPSFGNQFNDLWANAYGTTNETILEPYLVTNPISTQNITKQIWKRILNNLPYLLKNAGTTEGIRALINCYGVPETVLQIKEYGGPNKINQISKSTYKNYGYAWKVNPSSNYYFEISSLKGLPEFRFKLPDYSNTYSTVPSEQVLLTYESASIALMALTVIHDKYTQGNLNVYMYNGTDYDINTFSNIPIYNNIWNHCTIQMNASDLELCIQQSDGQEIIYTNLYTFPFVVNGDIKKIQFPGSIYLTGSTSFNIFDGELQELRLWDVIPQLSNSTINNHTLNPLSYNHNSESGSYDKLLLRLPFGSEGNIPNDLIYEYTSSIDISTFTQSYQPNQNIEIICTKIPDSMSLVPYESTYTSAYPDISTNRSISNKIRIEANNAFEQNILDINKRTENSSFDTYPVDSPKIGVYFSPTNEINADISHQMGGFNIDNYIGDYSQIYDSEYPDLNTINNLYFKKYTTKYNINEYFSALKYFDYTLFNQIKRLLPAKSKGLLGHVIEPHILNRSKIRMYNKPTSEDLTIETNLTSLNESANNFIGDINNYTGSIDYPTDMQGDYSNIESNIIITYNFISSSVPDTIITGSILSSYLQSYNLTLSSSDWITGSKYIVSDLTLDSDTGLDWTHPEYIIDTDGTGSEINFVPSTSSIQHKSKILTVQYTQSGIDFSNIFNVNGIELKLNKSATLNESFAYFKDNYIKIDKYPIIETTINSNHASLDSYTTDFLDYMYGNQIDLWGISAINKYNMNSMWAGIGIFGIYNITGHPANIRGKIDSMNLKYHYTIKNMIPLDISDYEPTSLSELKYDGCKIASTDFNQPSNDTPDGGPVVEYRIVNPSELIVENSILDHVNSSSLSFIG